MIDDRIPPQNIEAEKAVLGSMLLDKDACFDGLASLKEDDFYRSAHGLIFSIIGVMTKNGIDIDTVTVHEELARQNKLEQVGGMAYVAGLVHSVPTSANLQYYADIVLEKSRLRQITRLATEAYEGAMGGSKESALILGNLQHQADGITARGRQAEPQNMVDAVENVFNEIVKRAEEKPGQLTGLRTGFFDIDRLLGGFQPSDLIVLAGRPSMGKSTLAKDLTLGVARHQPDGGAILYCSLEVSRQQMGIKILTSEARVPSEYIRIGRLREEEINRLGNAYVELVRVGNIFIDDTARLTVTQLRAMARRLYNRYGLQMVVVDYLQLMEESGGENRTREVALITHGLKALAREFNIPVLAVSQLSRMVENRNIKIPNLADLRESGDIEQDADVVGFVYREEYYQFGKRPGEADLIVAKHRNGPLAIGEDAIHLTFIKDYARFESLSRR